MYKITRVEITEKRVTGRRKNNLAISEKFELLFVGNPEIDVPIDCWKEKDGKVFNFRKVIFTHYKSGRIRIKKEKTFYFSDKSGIKGVFKETHPEDR